MEDYYYSMSYSGTLTTCSLPGKHYSIIIFNCTLSVFGILSAAFLISIILTKRQLRSSTFTFLNHLIWAFVLKLILNGGIYTEEAFDPCWRVGNSICMIIKFAEPVTTYSVVVFLIAVAAEQCQRYRTADRSSNRGGSGTSKGLRVFFLYILVFLLSTPDLINALSLLSKPSYSITNCESYEHQTLVMYIVMSSKQCCLEYILPLFFLYIMIIVIFIRMIRSRVTAPAQTTTSYVNRRPPRYFALLVATALAYTVGYFPRYAFTFAHLGMRLFSLNVENNEFLGHLHVIDRIFALIPPAFFPLFVLTLSRSHLESGKEIFYRIKVRMSGRGWRSGSMTEANGQDESLNIGMDQLGYSS